jgi:hypothetical protein
LDPLRERENEREKKTMRSKKSTPVRRLRFPACVLGIAVVLAMGSVRAGAQEPNPLVTARTAHGGPALEWVAQIQMRGHSSVGGGGPITISASLNGRDADSLRVDYGQPVTRSFFNTPKGAAERIGAGPTVWKPKHVGAFAQLDILSALGIGHLASARAQYVVRGTSVVEGRPVVEVRAVTERTKTVTRRVMADEADVRVDQETGRVVEILRRQRSEQSMDVGFTAGFRFSDYRAVQGLLLPFRIERVLDGVVRETILLDSIELNPPVTPAFFEAPQNSILRIPRVR